ncbi:MAG: hypothetical protein HQK97_00710 [Nitrospirae bacterium]|nr:hypothetical protein [Nitrospirota bacterium]
MGNISGGGKVVRLPVLAGYYKSLRLIALPLGLALVFVLCLAPCCHAEAQDEGYAPSSVVFVVETSLAAAKADPQGLLFHALKLSAAVLSQDDSFGLIAFDEKDAKVAGKITPADSATYKSIDSISKFSSDNNSSSNPYNALSLALKEFALKDISATNRIIVLVSASAAYANTPEEDKKIRTAIMNELVPVFKDKGIRLFTVPLGVDADKDFLEELSRSTGGFSYPCPKAGLLNSTAAAIYETIKSPDILPSDLGKFIVDESIDQLTMVLSKKPDFKLILQSPEGENYSAGKSTAGVSWSQFSNFDIVKIDAPEPGLWNFLSVDEKSNHLYVSTHLRVSANIKSSYQRVYQPMTVQTRMTIDGTVIDMRELGDAIAVSGTMTVLEGDTPPEKLELKMADINGDKKGDKHDNSSGAFTCEITPKTIGINKLAISVKSKAIERSKSFIIAVIEEQESQKGKPLVTEHQLTTGKQHKITAWLSNKYVSHTPSALNKAFKRLIVINIVLFLSILLYINRAVLANIKLFGKRLPGRKPESIIVEEQVEEVHDKN